MLDLDNLVPQNTTNSGMALDLDLDLDLDSRGPEGDALKMKDSPEANALDRVSKDLASFDSRIESGLTKFERIIDLEAKDPKFRELGNFGVQRRELMELKLDLEKYSLEHADDKHVTTEIDKRIESLQKRVEELDERSVDDFIEKSKKNLGMWSDEGPASAKGTDGTEAAAEMSPEEIKKHLDEAQFNRGAEGTADMSYTPRECMKVSTGTQNYCPFCGSGR